MGRNTSSLQLSCAPYLRPSFRFMRVPKLRLTFFGTCCKSGSIFTRLRTYWSLKIQENTCPRPRDPSMTASIYDFDIMCPLWMLLVSGLLAKIRRRMTFVRGSTLQLQTRHEILRLWSNEYVLLFCPSRCSRQILPTVALSARRIPSKKTFLVALRQ